MDVPLPTVSLSIAASGAKPAEPNVLAMGMLVVGVLLLGFILVHSIRRKIARRQEETPAPRERIETLKTQAGARDSVDGARAELVDTARRLSAHLDVKAARLEQLIVQADERIAMLRRAAPPEGATAPVVLPAPVVTPAPEVAPWEVEPDDVESSQGGHAGETTEPEPPDLPSGAHPARTGTSVDPLTAQVYELADSGHDPVVIAQTLEEQIGKVELILALRQGA